MSNIKRKGILKRDDIAALRFADRIQFRSNYEESPYCTVTCRKALQGQEKEYTFELPHSFQQRETDKLDAYLADLTFENCTKDWELQTIFGNLQEFDEVEVIWEPNIDFQLWNATGVVVDRMKIIVYRKHKRFHYVLHTCVGTPEKSMLYYEI